MMHDTLPSPSAPPTTLTNRSVQSRQTEWATLFGMLDMPSEHQMAKDTHDLLVGLGLKQPPYRMDVCSGVCKLFPPGTYKHGLPLYAPIEEECGTDKARQLARPDFLVVDTARKLVELMVEFETDTNPKNLVGNFFSAFCTFEYKPKHEPGSVYNLDVHRTVHVLLACLDPRRPSPNDQAAVQKGVLVSRWLTNAGAQLAGNVQVCEINAALALAGDNWERMRTEFAEWVQARCSHLSATPKRDGQPADCQTFRSTRAQDIRCSP